ncbi:dihydrofolate reductase subunit [Nitritalea halalkaliphila LW7]|uniref:Dihydrofolate reductase n=1 Tax=Nitritalea halalkaliphila LW7 TaxID=1189621 RepID=I5C882_9BACT|nr:dihydrofolate reductase [Nitritalea halalkaliphila]EIM78034.1 dihydrofolate reductase subunit [Nitritalea halalkaliphila LW7]
MEIRIIVAAARNQAIGLKSGMPWKLSEDLKRFKALTMGHWMLMGRKTYDSLGRPLPGRISAVITRNTSFTLPEGHQVFHSLEEALSGAEAAGQTCVFLIGGGEIYRQGLPYATHLELTEIDAEPEADTFFPAFPEAEWQETAASPWYPADECHSYPYRFRTLVRRKKT